MNFFKIILTFSILLFISACTKNAVKDNLSDVASAGASATCTLINPVVGFVCGSITGAVVNSATPPEDSVDLSDIPKEQRAEVLKNQQMWKMLESLGLWAIVGVAIFFMLPLILGYFLPNKRQRKLEKLAFNNPDVKSTDLE